MCHLEIGGQKTHGFCHDYMAAPLMSSNAILIGKTHEIFNLNWV